MSKYEQFYNDHAQEQLNAASLLTDDEKDEEDQDEEEETLMDDENDFDFEEDEEEDFYEEDEEEEEEGFYDEDEEEEDEDMLTWDEVEVGRAYRIISPRTSQEFVVSVVSGEETVAYFRDGNSQTFRYNENVRLEEIDRPWPALKPGMHALHHDYARPVQIIKVSRCGETGYYRAADNVLTAVPRAQLTPVVNLPLPLPPPLADSTTSPVAFPVRPQPRTTPQPQPQQQPVTAPLSTPQLDKNLAEAEDFYSEILDRANISKELELFRQDHDELLRVEAIHELDQERLKLRRDIDLLRKEIKMRRETASYGTVNFSFDRITAMLLGGVVALLAVSGWGWLAGFFGL